MNLRVTIDGEECSLDIEGKAAERKYTFTGSLKGTGTASVVEVAPGIVSVLLNGRSYAVYVVPDKEELAAWIDGQHHTLAFSDARDRPAQRGRQAIAGPFELAAQMPGKVVKLLVEPGTVVTAGQSLIVVEAMKMQNEMKSPKDGTVTKIYTAAGATVVAGERLLVVE